MNCGHIATVSIIILWMAPQSSTVHDLTISLLSANNIRSVSMTGKNGFFRDLLRDNISPHDILRWSSSIETVDNYARVFSNRSATFRTTDFLCHCIRPESFGKYCEYELMFGSLSFDDSIINQFLMKRHILENQRWATIVCYDTLSCDFGSLCLDWRNICDGEQQCMDGLDEENCDKLEFNECEENEYRCSNGMCIDDIYFLDGKKLFSCSFKNFSLLFKVK